jgi:hypothetical protein
MNSTKRRSQRGARVLVGLIGGVVSLLGALAVWNLLVLSEAFAQESPSSTTAGETAPTETATPETAPKETAPTETAPTQTAPTEAVPTEAAPKPKQEVALLNLWPDITGLVMQPVFLAVKLPVATVGAIVGACLWPFSRDMAEKTWDATVKDPWGWPDFVRRLGKPREAAP